jgi:hypothetical protein
VKLTVEIRDASFNLVNSYTSSVKNSSASLDTIDFNILNTVSTPWTASSNALYNIIYKVSSDSTSVSDTIIYNQNDTLMALDRGDWVNTFGQNNAKAIAIVYEFNSDVEVKSVMVPIQTTGGAATQVGGVIQIAVCAGTGFTNGTNPPTALIGVSANYAITQADITRGYLVVPVNEGPGTDRVVLPAGFYYIIATFNPANVTGAPRVTLINDAKIDQANGMNLFFSLPTSATPNTWFSGFTGSNQVNAIGIRPVVTKSQLSTKEETLLSSVSVSPNPASSFLNVNFSDVTGNFTLTMTDLTGKVVSMEKVNVLGSMQHTLSLNGLSAGVYMLNINDGKASATQKIVVQ